MSSFCECQRTKVIARQEGVDYLECLDCGRIFEAAELEDLADEELVENDPVLAKYKD